MTLTMSNRGWVGIPDELRKKYGLQPGSRVCIVNYGGVSSLVPALEDPIRQAAGMLKGSTSLTRGLLSDHQGEVAGA